MRPRGRRVLRRKTRRALVLRRQDWIVIAILSLALLGSILVWVLFFTAWSLRPPPSRTLSSRGPHVGFGTTLNNAALARLQ
jgi:hypothetical protein